MKKANEPWDIFVQHEGKLELDALNVILQARGVKSITGRTLLHFRHLWKDGFREYRSINAHDQWRKARGERERRRKALEAQWTKEPKDGPVLTRVEIRGFRAIRHADLSLGRINVFVGANGSGKSSILEAIAVLGIAASGVPITKSQLYDRGGRQGAPQNLLSRLPSSSDAISLSLATTPANGLGPIRYSIEIAADPDSENWAVRSEELYAADEVQVLRDKEGLRVGKEAPRSAPLGAGAGFVSMPSLPRWKPLRGLRDRLDRIAIYQSSPEVLRGEVQDPRPRKPVGLSGAGLAEAVDEILDLETHKLGGIPTAQLASLLGWAADLQISEPGELVPGSLRRLGQTLLFQDRYLASSQKMVPDLDVSEGALHLAFLMTLCEHPLAPPILALEQPETAFHPRLAIAALRLVFDRILANPQRQIFLTSHSPAVLDAIPVTRPEVRLFAVDRSMGGASLVRPIPLGEEIAPLLEGGRPLSELWLTGALGAVPAI